MGWNTAKVAVVVAGSMALVAGATAATLNVVVTNTAANPVPVTAPTALRVASQDDTQVLYAETATLPGGSLQTGTLNVQPYKTVVVGVGTNGLCGTVEVEFEYGISGLSLIHDTITVDGCRDEQRTIEMPGGILRANARGGAPDGTSVSLWVTARRN